MSCCRRYDIGSIIQTGPVGYTCEVFPRSGGTGRRICEMTLRDLKLMLFETRVDTSVMFTQSLFAFQHENILRCYEFFRTASLYCPIYEYCEGGTLMDLFDERKRLARRGGKSLG